MKIFIEGYAYKKSVIEECFGDLRYSSLLHDKHYMNYVGYYFNKEDKTLTYTLPKVLVQDGKLFGALNFTMDTGLAEPILLSEDKNTEDAKELLRKFLPYFQSSLFRYKKDLEFQTDIVSESSIQDILISKGNNEFSILEIIHKIALFSKKNKNIKHYVLEYQSSNKKKKINWTKTVSKKLPDLIVNNAPIYNTSLNKQNVENPELELLKIYVGILKYISSFYYHDLVSNIPTLDVKESQIEGKADFFLNRIRKIRKIIFNDLFREMSFLCEMFLQVVARGNSGRALLDIVLVKNYNLVFERMVDHLFIHTTSSYSEIGSLKNNRDGKIIDHIFGYDGLIGSQSIFYIGDSKYYKEDSKINDTSIYKQFTYAKNIIQFNINYLNEKSSLYLDEYWYRDDLTEGYNPTPNFFIRGNFNGKEDFKCLSLVRTGEPELQYHFGDRFFDRDSLRILNYSCSFLNILAMYALRSKSKARSVGQQISAQIRLDFITYLNDGCDFKFYYVHLDRENIKSLVNNNFKLLNGKCISMDNLFIIAVHINDGSLTDFINVHHFKQYIFK